MTVIRNNNIRNVCIKPGSNAASDTESLHLGSASASDTESINNEPTYRPLHPRTLPNRPFGDDSGNQATKKSWGKKKTRRYQNKCILQTLSEEDEMETALVVMDVYQTPFARLLEDSNAMLYWNAFIEKTEEEQENILSAFTQSFCNSHLHNNVDDKKEIPKLNQGKISWRVKKTLKEKMKKNMSIEEVKSNEDDILEFFLASPDQVYVKHPINSFDRLLVRAIAHYHGLIINSDNTECTLDIKPPVKISNDDENWIPAKCFLTDFIKRLIR